MGIGCNAKEAFLAAFDSIQKSLVAAFEMGLAAAMLPGGIRMAQCVIGMTLMAYGVMLWIDGIAAALIVE